MSRFVLGLLCFAGIIFADNIVENGKKPQGKGYTLKLTEDLRFGAEDGDDMFLWPGSQVLVEADDKGNIYVLDPLEKRIIQFDSQGKFVRLVGQAGEGPSEFQIIQSFQIMADGTGVAFGNMGALTHLTYYTPSIQFKNRVTKTSIGFILQSIQFSPNGKNAACQVTAIAQGSPVMKTTYSVLNSDLEELKVLDTLETPAFDPTRAGEASYWAEFMSHQFKAFSKGLNTYYAYDSENNLYSAPGRKYEITKWSPDLKEIMVIRRDYERVPQTEEQIMAIIDPVQEAMYARLPPQLQSLLTPNVIRKAIELAEFPPVQLPIGGLLTMEDGTLLTIHVSDPIKRTASADIFDKKGKFLGSFEHGSNGLPRFVFKNGYGYTVETDDQGDNQIVRYKVKLTPAG